MQITSYSVTPNVAAPGESVRVSLTIRMQSGDVTRGTLRVLIGNGVSCMLYWDDDFSLAAGRTATVAFDAVIPENFAYVTENIGTARALIDPAWQVHVDWSNEVVLVNPITYINRRYRPRIASFALKRHIDGAPSDEGVNVLTSCKLSLAADANAAHLTLKLYYAQDARATTGSPCLALTDSIGALLTGVSLSSTLIAASFSNGSNWGLLLVFGDSYESASVRLTLPRAFANLHLSGCAGGGAAFGKFSASAPGSPLLESAYPFRPLGGIEACAGVSGVNAPGYAQSAGTTYFATSGSSANALHLRRYGNLCMLSGKITPTQAIAGSAACYPICQLPAGATPPQNLYILQQGGAEHVWLLTLFTSGSGATDANGVSLAGRAAMSRYRDGGSYISCAVDRELFVCAMWIV